MNSEKLAPFAQQNYLSLETFKKDGTAVATPVWFVEQGGTIYVYTLADAWKVKRIRNNPNVRIAPCNMRGKVHGEWVEARARIVTGDEEQLGHELLDKKYGWQKKLGNLISRFRQRQRAVIAIEVS